jgi:hypothetical protein
MEIEVILSDEYEELEYAIVSVETGRLLSHPYWDYYTDQHPLIVDYLVNMGWVPSQKNLNELPWLKKLWENR